MNDKSDNLCIAIVGCGQIADAHLQEKRQIVGQHARNNIRGGRMQSRLLQLL